MTPHHTTTSPISVRDSIEPDQSAVTPPASTVGNVRVTETGPTSSDVNDQQQSTASQCSSQDVITIEHGQDLRSKCIIHEQILCRRSTRMRTLSVKATTLRAAYKICDDYLELIESITMADSMQEQCDEEMVATLLPIIVDMVKNLPLREYQQAVKQSVRAAMDRQFTDRNLLQPTEAPKTLKLFQGLTFDERMQLLNSEGLLEVADDIHGQVQKFMSKERQTAKNNVVRAWAQGRLRLRDTNERSVRALSDWLYYSRLKYDDVEHLYDIWKLAVRIDIEVLANECIDRLYSTASTSINNALSKGVPLHHLLRSFIEQATPVSPVQSEDIITTVFRHVFKDEKPPIKLESLVVETMAMAMDVELWQIVQQMVNHRLAHRLIEAMLVRQQIKGEGNVGEIKIESQHKHELA